MKIFITILLIFITTSCSSLNEENGTSLYVDFSELTKSWSKEQKIDIFNKSKKIIEANSQFTLKLIPDENIDRFIKTNKLKDRDIITFQIRNGDGLLSNSLDVDYFFGCFVFKKYKKDKDSIQKYILNSMELISNQLGLQFKTDQEREADISKYEIHKKNEKIQKEKDIKKRLSKINIKDGISISESNIIAELFSKKYIDPSYVRISSPTITENFYTYELFGNRQTYYLKINKTTAALSMDYQSIKFSGLSDFSVALFEDNKNVEDEMELLDEDDPFGLDDDLDDGGFGLDDGFGDDGFGLDDGFGDDGFDEDSFAETERMSDALLAKESTVPRIGHFSLYVSDKPIAFFDGHETDLKYIAKESIHHKLGSKKFKSDFVAVGDTIKDFNDVGISVAVETLEVEDRLAVSVSTDFVEFLGYSKEESGDFTPKFDEKEFLFKDDDIGTDESIFMFSHIIKDEHKTMFIVLKISEE